MATGTRKIPSSLLWGGLGVVILLLGVGSALFYLNRGQEVSEERLSGIQGILARFSGGAEKAEDSEAAPGRMTLEPETPRERTYTVRKGENLWAIARRGELVDSPWEWRNIVIQNKDKISYASVSEDTGDWKVFVNTGKELTVRTELPREKREVKKKYALQLLSAPERNLKKALEIVKMLLADGHFAYLYRIEVDGQMVYRVRMGFYETKEDAAAAGEAIHAAYADKKVFPEQYLPFLPSFREMRGERLDFGVQKSHPFVIEFPARDCDSSEAMQDLKTVAPVVEFAYLAEKMDETGEKKMCRARAGYFATLEEAEGLIQAQGDAGGGLWSEATVTMLEKFQEALPGQQIKLGKPSS